MTRRRLVILLASSLSCALLSIGPASGDRPAASQAAKSPSWDLSLAAPREPGKPFVLSGRLLGLRDSLPIRNATLRVYHADAKGEYSAQGEKEARLAGTLRTNISGGFRVRTILPGPAEGTPHIHFVISGPGLERQMVTVSLARRHGAGSDAAYGRLPWMVTLPAGGAWTYVEPDARDGYQSSCDLFVTRAAGDR